MNRKIWFLFIIAFFIILSSNIIFSNPGPFDNPRKCSDVFSPILCNSTTLDDVIITLNRTICNGTQKPSDISWPYVSEVYINATNFLSETGINVTCEFVQNNAGDYFEYIWYYNTSNWINIQNFTNSTDGTFNRSTTFKLNSSEGSHIVRCILSFNFSAPGNDGRITNECANTTYSNYYDNDDVNFTVTGRLTYDFWNLTNYTDGSEIASDQTYTRSNLINVSAHWNKVINNANISHNGTASWINYTISGSAGNWTNYTLNLTNSTEFTPGTIGISYIWANDTYSATNNTSPSLYFYLWGYSKIDQLTINDTFVYNNTPIQIGCKVIDNITNDGIANYNVSFYRNESYLSSALTNSSGWVNYEFNITATSLPQDFNLKCNITNNSTAYYNASAQNYNQTAVTVDEDGTINECSNLTQAGATYRLRNDITNAVNTTSNWACMNISASNITLDCEGHTIDGTRTANTYGIFSMSNINSTIKNCIISEWKYGIWFYNASNGSIQNVMTRSSSTYGIYFSSQGGASDNNSLVNVTVYNESRGIVFSQSRNNNLNNVSTFNNTYEGIYIMAWSHNNTLTNVTSYNNFYGIYIDYTSSDNNITGGALSGSIYDYELYANLTNYFRNNNFSSTDSRKIYFYDTTILFIYNNQSTGELWLRTNVSNQVKLLRKIISWNNSLMIWNETPLNSTTSANITIIAKYNITGLLPNQPYRMYNNSAVIYTNITNSSGNLPSFTMYLSNETEIKVELGGYSKITEMFLNQSTIYNGTSLQTSCKVINVNTTQPIENYNVSFYRNETLLSSSLTNSSGWANISFTDNTASPPRNYTIKCNITNDLNYTATENSNTTNLTVLNPYEIQIGNFYLHYLGSTRTKVNLYTTPTIYANVSDAWRVSNVIANLSYPGNAIIVNLSMSGNNNSAGWNLWNYTFNNSQYPLNTTGTYTIRIIANNSNGIENVSSFQTFNVSNNYTLDLTSSYTTYMRGENVTVQTLDVNSELVENVNWTANITKINQTYNFTSQATTFNYTILANDTEGNYSINANATNNNNTGNNTWNFNVSKSFTITITTDPSSSPGKYAWVTVLATLHNARGDLHTSSINANITCVNTMYPLNFSSGQATYLCRSPDAYSTSFNITVNVSDQYNNTGENYKTLTTESAPSTGGGGGGGGGGFVTIKNCSDGTLYNQCSSNRPLFCKNGILLENCSVCKCESGYDCQIDGSCKVSITILENFTFILSYESIEIERGENSSVIASLSNTGNMPLTLITLAESECCNVSMEENFSLNENEKRDIPISIHIPLFTNVGEHLLKIKIGKELFKKEETIKVIILENPQHTALIEFGNFLSTLENEIAEYKKAGVDVRNLENAISESRKMILNANSSIEKDDLEVLKDSIKNLKENINSISSSMLLLRTQRILFENKFLIALLVVMSIMTVYFVPEVFIPLYKLEGKIKKFKTEENDLISSRVQTEKQYFMRKIDENTFSKIMITKQDQILKLKATIEEREKGRKEILLRMHPKEMLKWFGRGIKNLPKNIKNLILRTIEKIKSKKSKAI